MTRRRFVFWLSFGLFGLSEKFRIGGLDTLAAATMKLAEPNPPSGSADVAEHWTLAENNTWRWFERETFAGGRWKITGITTPLNKSTGEYYTGATGYLDESLVPAELRSGDPAALSADDGPIEPAPHVPDAARVARHGRPPSRWLRSLYADELRIWLKTIDVPEAGVSGMTYWTHLTRDHFFDPKHIAGLTEDEQAKLHAAAHFGY
jgi:hypothetical protein